MQSQIRVPIVATLMAERPVALAITGFALLQELLIAFHLPSWPCPILHTTGIPCPGCGLSRAIGAMFRGDWATMITFHAFAPVFVLALCLIACAALLPQQPRQSLLAFVYKVEQRTGITAVLLIGLLMYWVARLATNPSTFIHLIRS